MARGRNASLAVSAAAYRYRIANPWKDPISMDPRQNSGNWFCSTATVAMAAPQTPISTPVTNPSLRPTRRM